jgi:hypothetical protein
MKHGCLTCARRFGRPIRSRACGCVGGGIGGIDCGRPCRFCSRLRENERTRARGCVRRAGEHRPLPVRLDYYPRMGRHAKLTPQIAAAIVEAVRTDAPKQAVADKHGIGLRSINRWIERGETEALEAARVLIHARFDEFSSTFAWCSHDSGSILDTVDECLGDDDDDDPITGQGSPYAMLARRVAEAEAEAEEARIAAWEASPEYAKIMARMRDEMRGGRRGRGH